MRIGADDDDRVLNKVTPNGIIWEIVTILCNIDVRDYVRYNTYRRCVMTYVNATTARKDLYKLITDVNENSEPVVITNNKGFNAVLISEADWNAIQETLRLVNVPGFVESVLEADKEPVEELEKFDPEEEW